MCFVPQEWKSDKLLLFEVQIDMCEKYRLIIILSQKKADF